jgi:transcription antitermination factor NusG
VSWTDVEIRTGPLPISAVAHDPHNWYAARTSAHHEKHVADRFTQRSIEHFLPLYESMRRWKDRRVRLKLPLFPGYIFVRIPLRERLGVLETPGVACLVGFNGKPAAIGDEELESLRCAVSQSLQLEPHPYLTIGQRVRISAGPLIGRDGILMRRKTSWHVVLSMDLLQRSILVQIDSSSLEPLI